MAELRDAEASFARDGAAHLRGLFDPAMIECLRDIAERIYAEREALDRQGALPAELQAHYTRRTIPLDGIDLDGVPVADRLTHALFRDMARAYLGREPERTPHSHIRSMLPSRVDTYLPLHQDQTILGTTLFNIWIPLSDCGVDAPGLELVAGSWDALLPPAPPPDAAFPVERARLDEARVLAKYGEAAFLRPQFEAGDAMVFSGATIHRTHARREMRHPRMSVELRLV